MRGGAGGGAVGRSWQVGEAVRAVYSEDGLEYEGTVVARNSAARRVTVRFLGYNNEEEVDGVLKHYPEFT